MLDDFCGVCAVDHGYVDVYCCTMCWQLVCGGCVRSFDAETLQTVCSREWCVTARCAVDRFLHDVADCVAAAMHWRACFFTQCRGVVDVFLPSDSAQTMGCCIGTEDSEPDFVLFDATVPTSSPINGCMLTAEEDSPVPTTVAPFMPGTAEDAEDAAPPDAPAPRGSEATTDSEYSDASCIEDKPEADVPEPPEQPEEPGTAGEEAPEPEEKFIIVKMGNVTEPGDSDDTSEEPPDELSPVSSGRHDLDAAEAYLRSVEGARYKVHNCTTF